MRGIGQPTLERCRVAALAFLCAAATCASLACAARIYPEYHIRFQLDDFPWASAIVATFTIIGILFAYAEFSFGYFVGFYFFIMIAGYLWLNQFSAFTYNHLLSGFSAAVSALAFIAPALFIKTPLPQRYTLSPLAADRLISTILVLGIGVISIGAQYNFKIVSMEQIYDYRNALNMPKLLNYMIGITSGALLPFSFACCIELRKYCRATLALLLLLAFYPITLSKVSLLTSAWLIAMLLFSKLLELRTAVIVSLLGPLVAGILFYALAKYNWVSLEAARSYFALVNFRMVAIPSLAMDYYNDFFFRNDLTHFCQISALKPLMPCPYHEQISVVIYNAFPTGGNFNASLFATEGIASVGAPFAPITAFVCGLVIALANRASAHLPRRLVLVSGAVLVQLLLNVPFTTVLLTHGAILLFLLWYVTPTIQNGSFATARHSVAGPDVL
ncbi:hypothetical protein [Bradyrhizobium brasilense]|uniref:hypothetical protein n=1 Tax=Bradyrhizobium brasilense TaxID=1419277 RepID=UPI001F1974FB|nr:hypothetical protein [Bradyrhizobium brasilense]